MATLTPEQTDFLKSHHIPMDKTFDASGLSTKAYKAKMKNIGALVAYGVTPCPKDHTLRNKQGNCIQCSPHAIASLKRQATAGYIYIAGSPSERLLKISTSQNASDIAKRLNAEHHANINDWQTLLIGQVDSIGQTENQLQQLLSHRQVAKKLTLESKTTKASQVYDIDIDEAIDTLNELKFTLSEIDTPAVENFHRLYSEQLAQQQTEAERLAKSQADKQAIERQVHEQAKQAQLRQQRREQEQIRQAKEQQKLEQKRLRDARKQQKQQAKNQPVPVNTKNTLVGNAQTSTHATLSTQHWLANKRHLILIGVVIAIVLLSILMIALNR